jgi:hypothetical protein
MRKEGKMAEKTTEQMMEELKAAGYKYEGVENNNKMEYHVISTMGCDFRVSTYERTVQYAYWHLEERRGADMMRRALEAVIGKAEQGLSQGILKASELEVIIKVSKEALAKN